MLSRRPRSSRFERNFTASISLSAMPRDWRVGICSRTVRAPDKLIPRLDENEQVLLDSYDLITVAVAKNRRIAPAAEWLLDNFYLIEEQVRISRRHLPRSYSRELPRLANGPAAGYPRVYGIALELISHVDGRVDEVSLRGFIGSYQTITPLTLGELWAIPIMLRLALIENLRRVASRVAAGRRDRDLADEWAERMVRTVEQNPTDLILVLADMARANPPLTSAFLAELTRHLHGQSPYFAFANSWLEHRVSEQGRTIEQLIQAESQAQASIRFRSATVLRASVFSARPIGSNSSRVRAWWNRRCGSIRRAFTRRWSSPHATDTGMA